MNKLYLMDAENCLKLIRNISVQSIYIDPPYNTKSNSFEYNDSRDNWNE
ncbi:hypothetical protein [Mycoplasmopsis columboralis]|nr:hypothetical protein [Mycoplasmopsis columboralis]